MTDISVDLPATSVAGGRVFEAVLELGAATASLGQPFGVGGLGAASSPMATVLTFPAGWRDRSGRGAGSSMDRERQRTPRRTSEDSSTPASRATAGRRHPARGKRPVRAGAVSDGWSSPLAPWRIRTLRYIAAHPGAGSREIAASSAGSCACETSTLLRRMEELDFVENMSRQGARRRAWQLTAHGQLAVSAADRPSSHLVAI
jgi:hypothetical protein